MGSTAGLHSEWPRRGSCELREEWGGRYLGVEFGSDAMTGVAEGVYDRSRAEGGRTGLWIADLVWV